MAITGRRRRRAMSGFGGQDSDVAYAMERLIWSTSPSPERTFDGITHVKGDGNGSWYSESGEVVRRVLAGAALHGITSSHPSFAALSYTLGDGSADWDFVLGRSRDDVLIPKAQR
ncbi:hypothetical protein [Cellulomonas fengjieae]|uniref:Uncharacterized protein n=1 Tax=Cellulomonas fengjieae TaxID=2819978 RepID=A0ABS3SBA7_9CELL|nr:hypothetical protein [Cellulomonas fengjieae]MBO3083028.1 hypothetical protein [Cellulomonas fengjieae]QVI65601.1 hypothetical protein KG102_16130 [Cellulomonas fengjieae]